MHPETYLNLWLMLLRFVSSSVKLVNYLGFRGKNKKIWHQHDSSPLPPSPWPTEWSGNPALSFIVFGYLDGHGRRKNGTGQHQQKFTKKIGSVSLSSVSSLVQGPC
ncbi:uncharacterized protein B0T23DRAFT_383999 [Neurospora hispaniola]|uniref:Uncharacterized protein n=1 Tax=Neurospora hispaniola TaxID=588809 RepID=A0AAJ0I3M3_9PEZI|nr:hypothetical protein B0T23DRAFT_383999 [Neurospora hispaniola]